MRVLTPWLAWASVVAVMAAVAGCGQKGPLSLAPPAASASAPAR